MWQSAYRGHASFFVLPIDLPTARLARDSCCNALWQGHVRIHSWDLLPQPLLYLLQQTGLCHALRPHMVCML